MNSHVIALVSIFLAALLMAHGAEGWGWLILIAVLCI
jgi:hypothetical protein